MSCSGAAAAFWTLAVPDRSGFCNWPSVGAVWVWACVWAAWATAAEPGAMAAKAAMTPQVVKMRVAIVSGIDAATLTNSSPRFGYLGLSGWSPGDRFWSWGRTLAL